MPAAAVIPAPIAYIKVVAVKKLVVGFLGQAPGPPLVGADCVQRWLILVGKAVRRSFVSFRNRIFYCEKIRVFKAGLRCEYISME